MEIKLSLNKDVNANANNYFSKAKKLKAKLPGIDEILKQTEKEIKDLESRKDEYHAKKEKEQKIKIHKKVEWYDKFRSTTTSGGFLVVIGKDAGSNEVLIKKHMEENDLVMHTETPGSPFGLIKEAKDKIPKQEVEEALQFVACFSQQWKRGFGTADAFYVNHDQISKKAESGEYIAKGAFMVRGNKTIVKSMPLRIHLGVKKTKIKTDDGEIEIEELFSGSEKACKKFCKNMIKLEPGQSNYKALTKEIKKRLKFSNFEDLPKYIPNNCRILKK